MQSEFGGVSEMQQFMVDSCTPSLFSSPPPPQNSNPNLNASTDTLHHHHHHHYKFNPVPHHHPLHIHPQPMAPSPHFTHFGQPIPITQQLFHQQQHFQLFHHHPGPENSNSSAAEEAARMMGSGGGFLAAAMNFKLGVNESSSTPGPDADEDDGILQGPDDGGSESRLHSWHTAQDDDSPTATATASIKEPFWRPLDIDYINPNNKRPAESQKAEKISSNDKLFKKLAKDTSSSINNQNRGNNNYNAASATTNSNYKLFSELEAIYKPGTTTSGGGGGGGSGPITNNTSKKKNNNHQTGSGSAVTGDDNPIQLPAIPTIEHQPDNGSDSSNGGQNPSPVKPHKNFQKGSSSERRKRAKRRLRKQLTSIATLFESLVKQLMDHEENLHQKFLQVMEKRDKERSQREEAWRKQEAAKVSREAAIRAQERALSASRESAIISFLEKITGETFQGSQGEEVHKEEKEKNNLEDAVEHITQNSIELYNADDSGNNMIDNSGISSSRWPKAEVQALIRVRSSIESRFQEPGLKGPLWEEVSTTMRTLGYIRSAKRCKEKWENINKYFRKMKDSGRKRPMHSKTCPYFHQLGQWYSKSLANNNNAERNKDANSELLDAIVVSNNENIKFSSVNRDEGEKEEEDEINEEEGEGDNSQQQAQDRDTFLNQEHYQLFNSLRSSKCSEVIMKCQ